LGDMNFRRCAKCATAQYYFNIFKFSSRSKTSLYKFYFHKTAPHCSQLSRPSESATFCSTSTPRSVPQWFLSEFFATRSNQCSRSGEKGSERCASKENASGAAMKGLPLDKLEISIPTTTQRPRILVACPTNRSQGAGWK
jgi:hypothetical protein